MSRIRTSPLVKKRKCPRCGEFRRLRKLFTMSIIDGVWGVPWVCKVCDTLFLVRVEASEK